MLLYNQKLLFMIPLKESIEASLNLNSISRDEVMTDIKAMQKSPTKAEKQAVAGKYGISSNKAAEIEKALRQILVERHRTKAPGDWTEEDFDDWWSFYNAPTSAVALKKALAGESGEWVKFVRDMFEKTLAKKYVGGDYYVRAANSFHKYTTGLINDATNKADVNRTALIEDLMEKTKEFHDNYIERVRDWADSYYDTVEARKDWEIEDYMAYIGTEDRLDTAQNLEKTNGRLYLSKRYTPAQLDAFSVFSEEYMPKKTIKVGFKTYHAEKVLRGIKKSRTTIEDVEDAIKNDTFSDIPSINAIKSLTQTKMMEAQFKWDKKKFIEKIVEDAEKKYRADIELVADRVRKMKMNEKSIEVLSQQDDPKAFDMVLTDGQKQVRARSIYAAENSVKVTPHYRFIIT